MSIFILFYHQNIDGVAVDIGVWTSKPDSNGGVFNQFEFINALIYT